MEVVGTGTLAGRNHVNGGTQFARCGACGKACGEGVDSSFKKADCAVACNEGAGPSSAQRMVCQFVVAHHPKQAANSCDLPNRPCGVGAKLVSVLPARYFVGNGLNDAERVARSLKVIGANNFRHGANKFCQNFL